MGKKVIKSKELFVFETEEEERNKVDKMDKAREYFGSARLFLNEGLGYKFSKVGAAPFRALKKVKSISFERWRNIEVYASRYENGERYDPETFVKPQMTKEI